MNNDDVKKYINLSKLYTEVQLDEKKQVDENWFTDKIKEIFGITDAEAEKLNKTAKDAGIDTENPEGKDAKKAGVDNPNVEVTTQDQANSIFQNPDATDAERKAAQDFYNANKGTAGDNAAGNNFATDADGNIARKDDPIQPGGQDAGAPVGKSFADIGQAMLDRKSVV